MTKETKSADTRTANTTEETRGSVAPLGWDKISGSEETSAEAPKHTPTPWRYEASTKTIRAVPSNYWLATMDSWDGAIDNEANAGFIVRAVNSHDDLLASLREYKAIATSGGVVTLGMAFRSNAAIARAEGRAL